MVAGLFEVELTLTILPWALGGLDLDVYRLLRSKRFAKRFEDVPTVPAGPQLRKVTKR
jgi:hypothetical protein